MIPFARRRPGSITGFAVLFFAAALLTFAHGITDLAARQTALEASLPAVPWSEDAVIVWQSMWLSIALIPVAMVWLSAVRFARWMVTGMALAKLANLLAAGGGGMIDWAAMLLGLIAVALLFAPASSRWFAQKAEANPAPFR